MGKNHGSGERHYDFHQKNMTIKFRPELMRNFSNNLKVFGTVKSPIAIKKMYQYFKNKLKIENYDIFHGHTPHLSMGPSIAAKEYLLLYKKLCQN